MPSIPNTLQSRIAELSHTRASYSSKLDAPTVAHTSIEALIQALPVSYNTAELRDTLYYVLLQEKKCRTMTNVKYVPFPKKANLEVNTAKLTQFGHTAGCMLYGRFFNGVLDNATATLMRLCVEGYGDIDEMMLRLHDVLANSGRDIDSVNRSVLHMTALWGSATCLQTLVMHKRDIDMRDKFGLTPAMWACHGNRLENLLLFEKIAKFNGSLSISTAQDLHGLGPLYYALRSKKGSECFEHLLKRYGAKTLDMNGQTVLHHAAVLGLLDACRIIIELTGSSFINIVDRQNRTAVHLATMMGNGNVVKYLLEMKAKPDICDNRGLSAMHHARNHRLHYCLYLFTRQKRTRVPPDPGHLVRSNSPSLQPMAQSITNCSSLHGRGEHPVTGIPLASDNKPVREPLRLNSSIESFGGSLELLDSECENTKPRQLLIRPPVPHLGVTIRTQTNNNHHNGDKCQFGTVSRATTAIAGTVGSPGLLLHNLQSRVIPRNSLSSRVGQSGDKGMEKSRIITSHELPKRHVVPVQETKYSSTMPIKGCHQVLDNKFTRQPSAHRRSTFNRTDNSRQSVYKRIPVDYRVSDTSDVDCLPGSERVINAKFIPSLSKQQSWGHQLKPTSMNARQNQAGKHDQRKRGNVSSCSSISEMDITEATNMNCTIVRPGPAKERLGQTWSRSQKISDTPRTPLIVEDRRGSIDLDKVATSSRLLKRSQLTRTLHSMKQLFSSQRKPHLDEKAATLPREQSVFNSSSPKSRQVSESHPNPVQSQLPARPGNSSKPMRLVHLVRTPSIGSPHKQPLQPFSGRNSPNMVHRKSIVKPIRASPGSVTRR